jgi:hypothetical protein
MGEGEGGKWMDGLGWSKGIIYGCCILLQELNYVTPQRMAGSQAVCQWERALHARACEVRANNHQSARGDSRFVPKLARLVPKSAHHH